ncbi:hypothetical protein OS493_040415 [Desmophyllum pertusum]|uniref:Uncharacterized protein n=1 Tax=Desmophyllum pertusum TaxID=174260 RepID=A0A9W9YKB0_9CNID|nr:hypothetical protein OS493_040415 [Desmophyllum pertusum]
MEATKITDLPGWRATREGSFRLKSIETTMKSPLVCPREIQTMPWPFQVTRSIPVGYPQVKKLLPLRAPEPTPQRRKMNCFQRITSTSWWPRSGPRSIKRSKQLFLITNQVRRPVSRLTRKTMRRHRILTQKTNPMIKRVLLQSTLVVCASLSFLYSSL